MLSPPSLSAKVSKAKAVYNIPCAMVDYIQLMHIPKWRGDNRVTEVTRISNELRAGAKRAKVPIVVVSQMSRALEGRAAGQQQVTGDSDTGSLDLPLVTATCDSVQDSWMAKGIEQSALAPSKTAISEKPGARSGALKDKNDPNLAWLTEHWPALPESIRKHIITQVRAALNPGVADDER